MIVSKCISAWVILPKQIRPLPFIPGNIEEKTNPFPGPLFKIIPDANNNNNNK